MGKPEQETAKRSAHCVYGSDVEEALVHVWEQSNRVCSKRLIPFLPTVLEAMQRHGPLHLTPECRQQVLAMSAAIAEEEHEEPVSASTPVETSVAQEERVLSASVESNAIAPLTTQCKNSISILIEEAIEDYLEAQ